MRVIFLADVSGSGIAGEVKEVKNGYARNFLIPQKLAVVATHDQLQRIEGIRKVAEERRLKEEKDLSALAEHLAQLSVTITAKMGPTGRFYGAVTSARITEELSRLTGREFDRRTVRLEKPIQEPGSYEVELRLGHGIAVTLPVTVEGEAEGQPQGQAAVQEQPRAQEEVRAPAEKVEEAQEQALEEEQAQEVEQEREPSSDVH